MFTLTASSLGGNIGQETAELTKRGRLKCAGFKKVKQSFRKYAEIVDPLLKYGIACVGGGFNDPI